MTDSVFSKASGLLKMEMNESTKESVFSTWAVTESNFSKALRLY